MIGRIDGRFSRKYFSSVAKVEIGSQSKLGEGVTFFQPSVNYLFKTSILQEMRETESQLKRCPQSRKIFIVE